MLVLATAWLMGLTMAEPVQWSAPAGCPDAAMVGARVQELVGRMPTPDELHAVAVVEPGPPWRLALDTTIEGRQQRRTLEADDCKAVAEAAALILAVSVDPVRTADEAVVGRPSVVATGVAPSESVSTTASDPSDSGASDASSASTTPPERTGQAARPWLRLRVGAGGELGAVPGGTGGVRLGLGVVGARGLLVVAGSYWIDRLAELRPGLPRSGARIGLGTASVRGGLHLDGARVSIPLTVGVEAGGLVSRGVGLDNPERLVLPWLAGLVGGGVEVRVGVRARLWGTVEAFAPMTRAEVRIRGSSLMNGVLYAPARVGGRALIGVSFTIAGPRDG